MKMRFTKMHGLGNDFVLMNCIEQACPPAGERFGELSRRLCNRRFGIGADQILLLYPSSIADFRMKIFNADGGEVEMCGNGMRCVAKYIWDRNLSDKDVLNIETLAGIIKPEKAGDMVRVDMGEPVFEPEKIPVNVNAESNPPLPPFSKGGHGGIIDYPLQAADREFRITCVSMGNPHAVIVIGDVSLFPVAYYGPVIESHPFFPRKTNVEFIQVLSRKEIKMRVWERGSGETTACGTGASAAAVAANIKDLADRNVTIHLLGGDLSIEWASNNRVYMTGPATEVFEGEFDLDQIIHELLL
jgi:diaminopimelate epimerase